MSVLHPLRRILALTLVALAVLASPRSAAAEKLPSFDLPRLDGSGNLKLEQVLGKGPVLINFWASWCRPCLMEAPALIKLHQRFSAAGFEIVAISLDRGRMDRVKEIVKRTGMHYPVLTDEKAVFATKMKVVSIPTSVLIDSDGNVVEVFQGYHPGIDHKIAAAIEKLLPNLKS